MKDMTIQQNVSLKPYNTFGLEATARFFVENTVFRRRTERNSSKS